MRTHGNVSASVLAILTDRVAKHATIGRAVADGVNIVDVVVQDEFTHDVIAESEGVWLVYDST